MGHCFLHENVKSWLSGYRLVTEIFKIVGQLIGSLVKFYSSSIKCMYGLVCSQCSPRTKRVCERMCNLRDSALFMKSCKLYCLHVS